MRVPFTTRVSNAVLGVDRRQRFTAVQTLTVLLVYAVFAVVQHIEVLVGLIDIDDSWLLSVFCLAGGVGFYALVRSGANLHLGKSGDTSLSIPQSVWAMSAISWSYAITGPARGAVILITVPVMLYGVFALSARQARTMAVTCVAMLASVMTFKAWTDPVRYDPRVELMHFVFAAIVLAAIAVLARRITHMRERLHRQHAELWAALERNRELAERDELTGLLNRRAAGDRLLSALTLRQRIEPPPMVLALLDLDHFKRVNDQYGHAAGDAVLQRFARASEQEARAGDLFARWGGEEFLIALPAGDLKSAESLLARLQARMQCMSFDDFAPGLRVSFSAGVAECAHPEHLTSALKQADLALYRAKTEGRARVICAQRIETTVACSDVAMREATGQVQVPELPDCARSANGPTENGTHREHGMTPSSSRAILGNG